MDRTSCVLPSNAPSIHHESTFDDLGVQNRILQERCNNRQQDFLDQDQRKHGLYQPTENYFGGSPHGYLPPSQSSRSTSSHGLMMMMNEPDERVAHEAQRLWAMLQRSDAYRKYRARQPKSDDGTPDNKQDQKWPEHMEMAFFAALVKYPPMGRQKQPHEGKLRGRNELIAYAIEKWTGEGRTRKQVSSHIQVLKPLFKEFPKIMRYMAKVDTSGRHKRHHSTDLLRRPIGPQASMRSLEYNPVIQDTYLHHAQLPPPQQILSSSTTLTPACFEMNARDTTSDPPRSLHCFTHFAKRAERQSLAYNDPQTANLPKHLRELLEDRTTDSDVILADSSIMLMAKHIAKDSDELGIQIEFSSSYNHSHYDRFESHTRFYNGNDLATSPIRSVLGYDMNSRRLHAVAGTFGSGFWAAKLGPLSMKMREANKKAKTLIPAMGAAQAEDEELLKVKENVKAALASLSAVQEIFAIPREGGNGYPEPHNRILVVGWTFRHAEPGTEGETTWRRVMLPHQTPPSCKDEPLKHQESFAAVPKQESQYSFEIPPTASGLITPTTSTQPSFDGTASGNPFDLDPLTSMGLTLPQPMPLSLASSGGGPHMSAEMDANALDFTGGHINVWMEPAVSMHGGSNASTTNNGGGGGGGYYDIGAGHPGSSQHSQHHHQHHHHQQAPTPHPQQQQVLDSQQPHTPVFDHLAAYNPRQSWSAYGGLMDADMYGGHAGYGADAGYGDPTGQVSLEKGKSGQSQGQQGMGGGGGYLEGPMSSGRRDSGMLGL
ncbi:TEA/ATTS domain family-domain-containing protein [Phyllosticta citribraziliensis]|uniref:TEA/ATTS domain family-domain-containing protein n=1 Tax=Phyllosticta citribraziliensis TaxID=989973 RepID=A0ABR1M3Y8_9PEZI